MIAWPGLHRGAGLLPSRVLTALLVAMPVCAAEAQVRRGDGERPAAAARPQAMPAQRPSGGPARANVQGGNRANVVGSGNVQGGNRTIAGSNVNIGNEINVVRPPAGGGYPAYRAPVVAVPVYPGYAAPSAGAVVAAGVVAGVTAGLVASAAQPPSSTTVIVTSPPSGVTLAVGTQMTVLPTGCTVQVWGSTTYHRCGSAWVQPYMQGAQVVYVVVTPPG